MFERVQLKELCTVNQGLQIPISKRKTEPGDNRYFYITVQFLKNNSENFYIENPPVATTCTEDEILMVRTGNTGQVITGVKGCFHNNFFKVKPNGRLNPKYLYYVLKSEEMYKRILNAASGTTIPDLKHSSFYALDIPVPDMEIQIKIASILSAIDKKIETNNQINRNLSEQAQTLFTQYYESASGEENFTNHIKVLGGGTPKTGTESFWNGDIPFFTPKDVGSPYTFLTEKTITEEGLNHCNSRLYPVNTTFVTARGTVGKVALAGVPMAMNQSCYALASDDMPELMVYYYTLEAVKSLKHKASGAVFDAIVTRDFDTEVIKIISIDDQKCLVDMISPMFDRIHKNTIENQRLMLLRDSLLPKLMSGELDVSDLDI